MAKYLEVLEDGLTVGGQVRMAGDVASVGDDFEAATKSAQVERWGTPRYKMISGKEFEERGGEVEAGAAPFTEPEPAGASEPAPEAKAAGEFDDLAGLNVDATLSKVSTFDDEKTARFIAFEKAGSARKGVLGPLGAL